MPAARPSRPALPAKPSRHVRTARPARAPRLGAVLGAAVLLPAMVAPAVGAATPTWAASTALQASTAAAAIVAQSTALPASAPAGDVSQPSVRAVALKGIDRSVLAIAPAPEPQDQAQLGQLATKSQSTSTRIRLKPALATTVAVSRPAELVAVAADAAFPEGSSIQVRVREKKHGWSQWADLHVDPEHGPDPGSPEAASARIGSDPLLAVDATTVQVRIDTPTGKVPRGTELTLVNAPSASSDARRGVMTAQSAVGQPAIVTRSQWGADESWRSREPYYTDNLRAGFVHHTASTSNYSASQAAAQIRAIYAYHTKSLRHSDIDYNFVVDRFGRLYEGRYGGIDKPVLGGHTAGFNEHTFAVVALGNFSDFNPPAADMAAMKDSIARLFAWKLGIYGVNPDSTVKLVSAGYIKATRYPKGSTATISATSSHQTVNFTACPGSNLQAQMPAIRALGGQYSDVVINAPSPAGSTITAGQGPVTFTTSANRAVSWTADILSPCSDTPIRTFQGSTAGAGALSITWDLADSAGAAALPATYTIRISGSAADGTPVATVTSDLTIEPAPGGVWGPCANASRVVGTGAGGNSTAATSVLWGRISAPSATVAVVTGSGAAGTPAMATGLSAAPLARSLAAPLLLTTPTSLDPEVSAEIQARRPSQVLIVGGPEVVSDAVAAQIAGLGAPVVRIGGATPAATAAAVAAQMPAGSPAVLVSPDGSPAHALAGAALAAARGVPLLLAAGATVPAETAAALVGRPSFTVVASADLPDAAVATGASGIAWDRLVGPDAVSASLAVAAAFPGAPASLMIMPESPGAWAAGPVAAAAGVPIVITTSPSMAPAIADFIRAHPALGATTTPVSRGWLDDQVLGATSRVLLGLPWAPQGVSLGASPVAKPARTATATRKVATAHASPEPVRKGRTVTVTAKVTAKFTDKKWRKAPAGIGFVLQFKASGAKKYKAVATGTTTSGRAKAKATATKSGRWRIVVGSKVSKSDYVRVKK